MTSSSLCDKHLEEAIRLSNAATAKDCNGSYADAFELYVSALESWKLVCKFQQNASLREKLYKKMEAYVSRAEYLKTNVLSVHTPHTPKQNRLLLCAMSPTTGTSSPTTSTRFPVDIYHHSNNCNNSYSHNNHCSCNNSYDHTHTTRNNNGIYCTVNGCINSPMSNPNIVHTNQNINTINSMYGIQGINGLQQGVDTPQNSCGGGAFSRNDSEISEDEKIKEKLSMAIMKEKPDVQWSDIAGLEAAKEALQEAVILPSRFPNLFTGERRPWRGILLYGPPGTGKTLLAKAVAAEANATILCVSSADLVSKWQGESEKLVRSLFQVARERSPSVIFIDEVDSMCGARSDSDSESSRRMKTEFLIQMHGISFDSSQVLVLGATNVPWTLDTAIRRRFERRIFIPLPNLESRSKLLRLCVGNTIHQLQHSDFEKLAKATEFFSGSDISVLVRDALFEPIRKCRAATHFKHATSAGSRFYTPCDPGDEDPTTQRMNLMSVPSGQLAPPDVTMNDFVAVLERTRPSVTNEDMNKHVDWTKHFGLEGS